jgi:hypothetical protein
LRGTGITGADGVGANGGNMKYTELMEQPDGVVFYEDDLPAPALLQKLETLKDDIVVRQFDVEFEQSRLGLREMEGWQLNSKDYRVFSQSEIEKLTEFASLAYLSTEAV